MNVAAAKQTKKPQAVVELPSDDDSLSSVKNSDDEESEEESRGGKTKAKKRAGTNETMSDSSDNLAEPKQPRKGRGRPKGSKNKPKEKESPERAFSPLKGLKRRAEDSDSDISIKSLHMDSSSTSDDINAPQKKRKAGKDAEGSAKKARRKRSLTPIEQVDTFAVAHALQDVRRSVLANQCHLCHTERCVELVQEHRLPSSPC